jgi:hypothetical protein
MVKAPLVLSAVFPHRTADGSARANVEERWSPIAGVAHRSRCLGFGVWCGVWMLARAAGMALPCTVLLVVVLGLGVRAALGKAQPLSRARKCKGTGKQRKASTVDTTIQCRHSTAREGIAPS